MEASGHFPFGSVLSPNNSGGLEPMLMWWAIEEPLTVPRIRSQ